MTRTTTTRKTTRATAAAKPATKRGTATPKLPLLDVRGVLDKLKLPGIDVPGLIDSRRKDIEALLTANELAYRGFEAVTRRQSEMLAEAISGLKAGAKDALAGEGVSDRAGRVVTQAQHALGQALANMKEIAELSAHSQQKVLDTLKDRLRTGISEASRQFAPKP